MSPIETGRPSEIGWLRRSRAVLAAVGRIEMVAASTAFVIVCVVVAINAFMRAAMNSSLIWSEEVAMLAFRVCIFVGAAVIYKSNADIAVTMFVGRMRPAVGHAVRLATFASAICLFGLLTYLCLDLWQIQKNSTTMILEINRYWGTVPLLYMAASMLVSSIHAFIEELMTHDLKPIIEFPQEPE